MKLSEAELATIAAYEVTAEDWAMQHNQPLIPRFRKWRSFTHYCQKTNT